MIEPDTKLDEMVMPWAGMRMSEMCDTISFAWARNGVEKTSREIFDYSPSGELSAVYDWFCDALAWIYHTFGPAPLP